MTLHPMEFSDILDAIFSLYRRHFQLFLGIAVVYLVGELGSQLLEDFPWFVHQHLLLKLIEYILIGLFTFLRLVSLSAIVVASATLYMGGQITGRAALRQTLQRFFPLLSCAIVWILVVISLAITIIGSPFALYFGVRWGFFVQTVLFEKVIVRDALRRSSELVSDMWWRVCGTLVAILLIDTAIHAAFEISFGFILVLTGSAGEVDLMDIIRWATIGDAIFGTSDLILYIATTGIHLVLSLFLFPILGIGSTLLYFNQRILKEGFDIEMRANLSRDLDDKHKM